MRILAVVVRYGMALEDSQTIQGLCAALETRPGLMDGYSVLVWDNSPEPLANLDVPIPCEYRHSPENAGVSGAYNGAMQIALARDHPWLLLLDQDSAVTAEFLETMLRHARELLARQEIAAIAPTVKTGSEIASPRRQLRFNTHPYPARESGAAPGEATAVNSGALMRVSALSEIGGFSRRFWLDYSDVYVFHQFYLHGKRIWWAADAELPHALSSADRDRPMPEWRYKNYLSAQGAFFDLYRTWLQNAWLTARMFRGSFRLRPPWKGSAYNRITREHFLTRLRNPRAKRVAQWSAGASIHPHEPHV